MTKNALLRNFANNSFGRRSKALRYEGFLELRRGNMGNMGTLAKCGCRIPAQRGV